MGSNDKEARDDSRIHKQITPDFFLSKEVIKSCTDAVLIIISLMIIA